MLQIAIYATMCPPEQAFITISDTGIFPATFDSTIQMYSFKVWYLIIKTGRFLRVVLKTVVALLRNWTQDLVYAFKILRFLQFGSSLQ